MKMFQKGFWTICIHNHTYMMSHLQLCGMSLPQMKTRVSIDHQWNELWLLSQCASLCMEQYAWIHAISSKMHAEWFFWSFKLPEPHLGQDSMVRQDNVSFMEFQLLRTMDQVLRLDLGSYFHSAMLVTPSWSWFVPLGCHWFHFQSLLWPPVLVQSHPGPAKFCPHWIHSLVLTWFPWNCRVNGVCCLDSMPLQITTLCALHSVYNDKVSEIGEVPKLLGRLLDYRYMPLGHTNLPPGFKQDDLCRSELLDNFLDNSLLKLWLLDMAQRQLEVDMKVT